MRTVPTMYPCSLPCTDMTGLLQESFGKNNTVGQAA